MPRIKSNDVTMAFAREETPGVLPAQPAWHIVEPNEITNYGAEIKTVERNPISGDRQREKGSTVGLDSPLEIDADFTYSHMRHFVEAFCYSAAIGPDSYESSDATATGYTVDALSAAQAGRLLYGVGAAVSLVYARGYAEDANNGLKPVTKAGAAADTEIEVAGLVAEVPAAGRYTEVSIAGVRGAAGDLEIDANGDLISTALDFTTLGLTPGQVIHVGGLDAAYTFANEENYGLARLKSIAANKLELERREQDYVLDDGTDTGAGGAAQQIDILFGQFVRNVPISHADYREITTQFELTSPNLGTGGTDRFEYAIGNYADALTISIPEEDKATVKLGFVGLDTIPPTAVRATNAANASNPNATDAYGSASDIARLRVMESDETGMGSDFKTLSFMIKNNAAGEKVLGNLGPKYVNAGELQIDIDAEMIFTEASVIAAIRNHDTIGIDFTLRNGDGGAHFDVPSATMSGGARSYPRNESVKISTTIMAHKDDVLGTSLGISLFPILPSA